jgi:hypothetical protein
MAQKDLEPYLKEHFTKKGDMWYQKEDLDANGDVKILDVIPVKQRIEQLIRSILKSKKRATIDEIYEGLYINLTNGMTPDSEEIMAVLNRIAKKVTLDTKKREIWELDNQTSLLGFPSSMEGISEDNLHNKIIANLGIIGHEKDCAIHVGNTEQKKNAQLKEMSIPMSDNVQFGLNPEAFGIICEIDLLWLKKNSIISAFEVEKSTTIDSGINRFRNLFAAAQNLNIDAFIVVPDDRKDEAIKKINSPANKKEGIDKKIKLIVFSEILEK